MSEADLFLLFVRPLINARIAYMIGGSVASAFYGEHRRDIRSIIAISGGQIKMPDLMGWIHRLELADEWRGCSGADPASI